MAHRRRFEIMAELASMGEGFGDLDERLTKLCATIASALEVDACVIRTLDGDNLRLHSHFGLPAEKLNPILPANYGIAHRMMSERLPLTIYNTAEDNLTSPIREGDKSYLFISYAGAPMVATGQMTGVVGVYTVDEPRVFTEEDLLHLQIIANHVAVVLANERLVTELNIQKDELDVRVTDRTTKLRQANERLEQFCHAVAHDLRAPLRAIVSTSRMLRMDYESEIDDEGAAMLERQESVANQMAKMIDALLGLAEIGRAAVSRSEVDLARIAEDVVASLRPGWGALSVEFKNCPTALCYGDPVLLRTALQNLIENAVKFSSKTAEPHVEFGVTSDGRFFVADNGIGFEGDATERLFDPFQRLESAEPYSGLGIGLATVKRIIELHGGSILAESAPGAGARFVFSIGEP